MTRKLFCCSAVSAVALLFLAQLAHAGKIVLKIRAANPIEKVQIVKIKSDLPPRARTNDVISTDGLDLGYDINSDTYFVHTELELRPKEIRIFDIEIDDVWVVSEEETAKLRQRTDILAGMLEGRKSYDVAQAVRQEINKNLSGIEELQDKNSIARGVKAIQHIQAYEASLELLKIVKKDIARVENLVLGSGQDPGEFVWATTDAPKRSRLAKLAPEDYNSAVITIAVRNPSPTYARNLDPFRHDLPPEVKAHDILDAGGLEIGTDPEKGITYVYAEKLAVDPGDTVTFEVKIRDKWNVNVPRIHMLESGVSNLLARISAKQKFGSIESTLQGLLVELEDVDAQEGPKSLNERYVAFYREQANTLDVVEEKLDRIRSALRPIDKTTKLGIAVKAPSMKTTWMIIYIILGFLAVVSLLFFLRWFGRTKAEKLGGVGEASQPGQGGAGGETAAGE